MKHRRFNQIYPYTYFLKEKTTGRKYHGVRWANVRRGLAPKDDFGIEYFTSGKLKEDFKCNPENYEFRLCWTFDHISEARVYESQVNSRLLMKDDWEVWNSSGAIYNKVNPRLGKPVSTETREKISKKNSGKIRSSDTVEKHRRITKRRIECGDHYWLSEEHKERTSKRMKKSNPSHGGLSSEHKEKIGAALRGRKQPPFTEEHRKKLSESRKGKVPWNKGVRGAYTLTTATREKQSLSHLGSTRSTETVKKMKVAARNRPKVECPHCGKIGDISGMKRYHFDKCKKRKT
jgi:hypothetical protein